MLASYKGFVRSKDIAPIAETETEKNRGNLHVYIWADTKIGFALGVCPDKTCIICQTTSDSGAFSTFARQDFRRTNVPISWQHLRLWKSAWAADM